MRAPFVLVFLLTVITLKVSAAPLCARIFLSPPSAQQISSLFDDLARLTLEVDLAKFKSTEIKTQLEADLKLKQNEVMTALNLDRSGLRKQLRPRIQELQKIKKSSTRESTRRRQTEKKNLLKIPVYTKTEDVSFPLLNIRQVLSAKLPEITFTVNYRGQVALYSHNIAKNSGDYISGFLAAANISANKKTIYGITDQLVINKFRPGIQRSVAPPLKIKDFNNRPWKTIDQSGKVQLEVSPGEKFLALHIGSARGELYIIRIADGEVVHYQATGYEFGVKFRSDDEFYIFDATSIVKHNLSTQQKVEIENLAPRSALRGLWLDPKLKNLIHVSNVQMTILDPLTLEVKSSQDMAQNIYTQVQIPNSDRHYLAFSNNLPEIFDYTQKNQESLFSFEDIKALNTAFTDDGNNVLFFTGNSTDRQLSIWTREK